MIETSECCWEQAGYSLLSIDETAKTALHYGARNRFSPQKGIALNFRVAKPQAFYADLQFRLFAHSKSVFAKLLAHNSKSIQCLSVISDY